MMKNSILLAVVGILFTIAGSAQAVVIDMNSPQDGQTLRRGDDIQLGLTLENETEVRDVVFVKFKMIISSDDQAIVLQGRPLRVRMDAGQVLEWEIEAQIPEFLPPLPAGPISIIIEARAEGTKSGTESNSSVSYILDLS
jgi:hypothetical protein